MEFVSVDAAPLCAELPEEVTLQSNCWLLSVLWNQEVNLRS